MPLRAKVSKVTSSPFAHQLNSWALNRRGQIRTDEGEQELAVADFEAALDV